jgi:hypothetical protein
MAGLMALLTILSAVPGRLEGRQLDLQLHATAQGLERAAAVGVWVPPGEAIRQLLDLVKQGGWLGGQVCCQSCTSSPDAVAAAVEPLISC